LNRLKHRLIVFSAWLFSVSACNQSGPTSATNSIQDKTGSAAQEAGRDSVAEGFVSSEALIPPSEPKQGVSLAEAAKRQEDRASAANPELSGNVQPSGTSIDAELSSERAFQRTLPMSNSPLWDRLRQTTISIDESSQLYVAKHPIATRLLAGKTMTFEGFMLPLEPTETTTHFLISPYTPVCFFHPPAEPNEIIEVKLKKPVQAGYDRVEVTGKFGLANNGEKGLFFTLTDATARVTLRVEDP